jgi:hypothetical protein
MVEESKLQKEYPSYFKLKLRCLYYNLLEELALALLMLTGLFYQTVLSVTIIAIMMAILFMKPILDQTLRF